MANMQAVSKEKLLELQNIISKMPLKYCCVTILPEFGVRWKDVTKAVRNSHLPMAPSSVARVLCRHVGKTMPVEEISDIVSRLQLKMVASRNRKWHVITLSCPIEEQPSVAELVRSLPRRVTRALSRTGRRPEVQTVLMDELLFMSVKMVSSCRSSPPLYVASPLGMPVALVSSVGSSLIRGCVEGLGYRKYENANLHGCDIPSLLRIHDRAWNEDADNLSELPVYAPKPIITNNTIDYTNKVYNENYVDYVLGPNPPLLTDLTITSNKPYFDPTRLQKNISVTVHLKSDNVAKTLKTWVSKGALAPTSDLFQIFHKIKSNKFSYENLEVEE